MTDAITELDTARYPRVAAFLDAYTAGPGAVDSALDLSSTVPRCEVSNSPFVVATVDDFLPIDLYRDVLHNWSALSLQAPKIAGAEYVGSRRGVKLQDWSANTDGGNEIWSRVAQAARSARFVRALFIRFADQVEANLAHPAVADAVTPGFVLWANQDHGADEALGAHIDELHKLLTIVLYLDLIGPVGPGAGQRWGTAIYDIEPGTVKPIDFSANASHDPVSHVEFRPNRAFVMPNNERAFHGVAGGETDITRRSLMWGYWFTAQR